MLSRAHERGAKTGDRTPLGTFMRGEHVPRAVYAQRIDCRDSPLRTTSLSASARAIPRQSPSLNQPEICWTRWPKEGLFLEHQIVMLLVAPMIVFTVASVILRATIA